MPARAPSHPLARSLGYPLPTAAQSCRQWIHSDDYNPSTGAWPDRSPYGHDGSQGTAGKRPTADATAFGGFSCVVFDGSDDAIYCDSLATAENFRGSDWMLLLLMEFTGAAADFQTAASIGQSGGAAVRDIARNVSGVLRTRWVDNDISGNTYTHQSISGRHVVGVVQTGTNRSVYVDGARYSSDPRSNDVSGLGTLDACTYGARRLSVEDSWGPMHLREAAVFMEFDELLLKLCTNGMFARMETLPV